MENILFPANLQKLIEEEIVSGRLPVNFKIEIQELRTKFGSSAEDMNLVVSTLYRKGLVETGKNQVIKILGLPTAKIESVFQYAEKNKLKPSTVVRKVEICPADELIADKLHIPTSAWVFVQVRTRLINGRILANQYNFIPYEICPGLEKHDLSRSSFQVALEKNFHTVITRIHEDYQMVLPSRDDTEILALSNTDAILAVQRMSYSRSGFPLVFADIHVKPDQFHFVKDLWPNAVPLIEAYKKEKK